MQRRSESIADHPLRRQSRGFSLAMAEHSGASTATDTMFPLTEGRSGRFATAMISPASATAPPAIDSGAQ